MPVGVIRCDPQSAAFFDGTARGELLLRQCTACGKLAEPTTMTCPACTGLDLDWAPSSRRGCVVSWTVVHGKAPDDPMRTAVALVELDEGPWLEIQVVGIAPDAIIAGMPVRVDFERPDGGEALPVATGADQ